MESGWAKTGARELKKGREDGMAKWVGTKSQPTKAL